MKFAVVSAALALTATACGPETYEPQDAPALASDQKAVVYGTDDRENVRDHGTAAHREMARAVMLVTDVSRVNINATTGAATLTLRNGPLCAGEAFEAERAGGNCSAFLVAPDRIMTAGHCLDANRDGTLSANERTTFCDNARFVLDFDREADGPNGAVRTHALDSNDIYRCGEIINATLDDTSTEDRGRGDLDFAVIRLNRTTGRAGLPIDPNARANMAVGDDLLVIGHPAGLPKKIEDGGEVRTVRANQSDFVANLDTFGGNSGSPVINQATERVVGILVRGEEDYVLDAANNCYTVNTVANTGGWGEDSTHIAALDRWADVAEPNDTQESQSAHPLHFVAAHNGVANKTILSASLGGSQGFLRVTANDRDWFAVPANGGDDVYVQVNFAHADGDLDVDLVDANGVRLGTGHSTTDNEQISITVPGTGLQPVYVQVRGYNGATNDYTLTVDIEPDNNSLGTCDLKTTCGINACIPRPGRIVPLAAGEFVDLTRAPGVCRPAFNCVQRPTYLDCSLPVSESIYLPIESAHPYASNASDTWEISLPGWMQAARFDFDSMDIEATYDHLELNNGTRLDGQNTAFSVADVPGRGTLGGQLRHGLQLTLTTDQSVVKDGFTISGLTITWTP